jgi:hypothetical protein
MSNIMVDNDDGKIVKKHRCDSPPEGDYKFAEMIEAAGISNYGPAIGYIEYVEKGNFWVTHNDEYATVIKYCPFCGEELK